MGPRVLTLQADCLTWRGPHRRCQPALRHRRDGQRRGTGFAPGEALRALRALDEKEENWPGRIPPGSLGRNTPGAAPGQSPALADGYGSCPPERPTGTDRCVTGNRREDGTCIPSNFDSLLLGNPAADPAARFCGTLRICLNTAGILWWPGTYCGTHTGDRQTLPYIRPSTQLPGGEPGLAIEYKSEGKVIGTIGFSVVRRDSRSSEWATACPAILNQGLATTLAKLTNTASPSCA